MPPVPKISLCIPTFNRAGFLPAALESALAEAAAHPEGWVEVLVSDNGSTDGTEAVVRAFQDRMPALRSLRFPENRGFDNNYIRCMTEARGEFVWIMGDDDAWLPGSVARVLEELQSGQVDALLCAALECTLSLEPLQVRSWFRNELPAKEWRIASHSDFADYLDGLQLEAGIFGFISAGVIRRERWLRGLDRIMVGLNGGFIHMWGMVEFLLSPAVLRWVPEALFKNRLGNDGMAQADSFGRMIHDLRTWADVGRTLLRDHDQVRAAFMGVLRRNQSEGLVPRIRFAAEPEQWPMVKAWLLDVGYDPLWVETVEACHHLCVLQIPPGAGLDPAGLCLADLPLVARGARRVAVLALGGLDRLLEVAGLLAALRQQGRMDRLLVLCAPDCGYLLDGLEVLAVDEPRLQVDPGYQEQVMAALRDFGPELLINADRDRNLPGDMLVVAAKAVAALGYAGSTAGAVPALSQFLSQHYHSLVPVDCVGDPLGARLGLTLAAPRLWPDQAGREAAQELLSAAGWEPESCLMLLGDLQEELVDPGFQQRLQDAAAAGWHLFGVGEEGAFPLLEAALAPLGEAAINVGGVLDLGGMAGLIQRCPTFLGGSDSFQALARACGGRLHQPSR